MAASLSQLSVVPIVRMPLIEYRNAQADIERPCDLPHVMEDMSAVCYIQV